MSELAGKLNKVYILAGTTAMTGSTGNEVSGVDDSTYDQMVDLLEISRFGDTYKKRIAGLADTSVALSGNYVPTDSAGQLALNPGDFVYIGLYPQGTAIAGKQIPMIVEKFEIKATASGKQTFSASLSGNGAPVVLPART